MTNDLTKTRTAEIASLLAAARRVWSSAIPDRDHPNRVIANREAMEALGEILASF